MKPSKLYLLLFLCTSLIALQTLTGCRKPRHCEYLICQNGGHCDADTCVCQPGYSSALCQNNIRDQYLGSYTGTLIVSPSTTGLPATVTIKAGAAADAIIISSQVITLNATLASGGNFVIPPQSGTVGITSGSGSFSGKTLNFTANNTVFGYTINSSFTGTKP